MYSGAESSKNIKRGLRPTIYISLAKAEKLQSRLTNKFQFCFNICTDIFLLQKIKNYGYNK